MAGAVAIGLVSEARSKMVSTCIGVFSGTRERKPKALSKTTSSLLATNTTAPGNTPWVTPSLKASSTG